MNYKCRCLVCGEETPTYEDFMESHRSIFAKYNNFPPFMIEMEEYKNQPRNTIEMLVNEMTWERKKGQYTTKTGKHMLYDSKHRVWINVTPNPKLDKYVELR
jgi:hypothetical protein